MDGGGAPRRAATRDPKAIDDGLQSCITDTRVTRAISSDEAYERRETAAAVRSFSLGAADEEP